MLKHAVVKHLIHVQVHTQKRSKSEQQLYQVIDLVIVDRTGPVLITLWGADAEIAETLLADFLNVHDSDVEERPLMALQNLRFQAIPQNSLNGRTVTRINILTNNRKQASISPQNAACIDAATSPYMSSAKFVIPPVSVVLQRFNVLDRTNAPFRVSLRGTVVDVGDVESSQQGNSKNAFKVVDKEGTWLQCVVIGDQASNPGLLENVDVILFFASGRSSATSQEGAIFVFQTGCVWILGQAVQRPRMKYQIKVQ